MVLVMALVLLVVVVVVLLLLPCSQVPDSPHAKSPFQ